MSTARHIPRRRRLPFSPLTNATVAALTVQAAYNLGGDTGDPRLLSELEEALQQRATGDPMPRFVQGLHDVSVRSPRGGIQ